MINKKTKTLFVTFRAAFHLVEAHITTYLSVPVVVKQSAKLNAKKIIEEAQKNLLNAQQTLFSSKTHAFHQHRSIDEMRMFHAWNHRVCVHSQGTTHANDRPITIWQ